MAAAQNDAIHLKKEAAFYEKLPAKRVRCHLCAHHCRIPKGKYGICRVRQNIDGTLHTLVYGRVIARHVDPIEKKPLYHFYPGSRAYSIATPGCCLRCQWCQNWDISQMPREQHLVMGEPASPQQIVNWARVSASKSIAYTYTEPTVFFEYAYDTARLAHEVGLKNLFVTSGYMTEAMLEQLHPYLDAANVDLKGFRDDIYRRYAGARLEPVLETLRAMKRLGVWLEVTTLVIPGINDDPAELQDTAQFIAQELGIDTPWHISRFFPGYKMMDRPPTPLETLQKTHRIGVDAGLQYVYVGNVVEDKHNNTLCPGCSRIMIQRRGYNVTLNAVVGGHCPTCGTQIAGVGLSL